MEVHRYQIRIEGEEPSAQDWEKGELPILGCIKAIDSALNQSGIEILQYGIKHPEGSYVVLAGVNGEKMHEALKPLNRKFTVERW